jgi:hypothetical protein
MFREPGLRRLGRGSNSAENQADNPPARHRPVGRTRGLSYLRASYGTRGISPKPPEMMLAIVIYAYIKRILSTRKTEEALGDIVSFMYIANN